ncbi:MAG: hypothetical protein K8S54_12160 [Spirochaetia bacterium]|nr:hypothetical protein [Spirochaetia bacterium]
MLPRILVICTIFFLVSCNRSILPTQANRKEAALLVLPGFGYNGNGESAMRATVSIFKANGVDLFVADYVDRDGLKASQDRLGEFIDAHALREYNELYVFAFIAGAWTLNPYLETHSIQNLRGIIYDRSPYQERAPRLAAENLSIPTRIVYGLPVFDLAKASYPAMTLDGIRVGLLVESRPTSLLRYFANEANAMGPFDFSPTAFGQKADDCIYIQMTHDEMYVKFAELVPEIQHFISRKKFSPTADRRPPVGDLRGD